MEKQDLEEIAQGAEQALLVVITEEIYSELVYGIRHTSLATCRGCTRKQW